MSQQNFDDVDISTGCRLTQRCVVRDIAMFLVTSFCKQQLHHLNSHHSSRYCMSSTVGRNACTSTKQSHVKKQVPSQQFMTNNNSSLSRFNMFMQSRVTHIWQQNTNKISVNVPNYSPNKYPWDACNFTRKPSCCWQTRVTLAKSLHGLRKSSGVVSCIASLPIDSLPMVSYYRPIVTLCVKCTVFQIFAF